MPDPTPRPSRPQTRSCIVNPHQLWDWAGVDGLRFAETVFGDRTHRIAPFQSFETTYQDYPCSVLRLCEGNFRVAISSDVPFKQHTQTAHEGLRMWLKLSESMRAIALPDAIGMDMLPRVTTTKPIYSLKSLQMNCAIPARIDGMAVLIWRHQPAHDAIVELQIAAKDVDSIREKLAC